MNSTLETEHLVRNRPVMLEGNLSLPEDAYDIVVFAHGSGSNRRNRHVAFLNQAWLAMRDD